MNQFASHLLDISERQLKFLVETLEVHLDDSELAIFQKAQKAWRLFAKHHAEFGAAPWEGGTMRPLVYATELRERVIDRAAQIKAELDQRLQQEA